MRSAGKSASGRVLRARAHEIEVEAKSKRLVEIDGSVIGKTPISVSIQPAALTVIVPATTGSPEPPSG
jgi:diacylglycerol kinase family enzyme